MTDLPPGWEWTTLGEVAKSVKNGIYVSRPGLEPNGVPILRISAVRPLALSLSDLRYSGRSADELKSSDALVECGDLLFTRYSGSRDFVGVCARAPEGLGDLTYPDKLIRARLHPDIDPTYLAYAFTSPMVRSRVEAVLRTTAGQVGISGRELKSVAFPLAPVAEQCRIVAALEQELSRLDAGACLLGNVLDGVDRLECAVLCASLTSSKGETVATQPQLGPVDDGDLPPIPGSWRWVRLHEIAEVVGGVTKDTAKQSDPSIPLVPYLRVANVQRGWLDLSQVSEIRVVEARAKALALEHGDVLLNEGGDRDKLGRGWVWEGQIDRCIHQNHVFRARIRNDQLHPKLLAWHANSFGKLWFERNGRQTTNLASISLSKIKQLPVPVPPIEDQRPLVEYIEDHLAVTRRTVATVQQSMTRASQLRRSLLADAFAGRLAPQDPEDEPASVLLDRIRAERDKTGPTGRRRRASTLSGSRSNRGGADGR